MSFTIQELLGLSLVCVVSKNFTWVLGTASLDGSSKQSVQVLFPINCVLHSLDCHSCRYFVQMSFFLTMRSYEHAENKWMKSVLFLNVLCAVWQTANSSSKKKPRVLASSCLLPQEVYCKTRHKTKRITSCVQLNHIKCASLNFNAHLIT